MAGPLTIFCMNVGGLADRKKRTHVFNWLKKKMSVYCLTNIHISPANHNAFLQDWGNKIIINSFSFKSSWVSILLGDNVEYKILEVEKDDVGNLLIANICFFQEYTILLVVLYGPNRDDPGFYMI